jgi:hypothetical protein
MAKQNLTLDITATMGHPDICSVAEWLVEQGFIADWSENLDPFLPYDGEGDMIDYVWAHVGTRVLVDTRDGSVTCKVLISPDSKVMEVLADTDSDSAVADIYKYFVSRLSDKFNIVESDDLKETLNAAGLDPLAGEDEPKEEEKCPFCSGGSPDCDSEVLHMERDGDFADIFNEGKYMGTFHWKFCPLCAKPLA